MSSVPNNLNMRIPCWGTQPLILILPPAVIENYWGAAFHWIAYGCQRKHGQHKENHTQLGRYLRDQGEPAIADRWDQLERSRQGSMYGHAIAAADVQKAQSDWQAIRTWALS